MAWTIEYSDSALKGLKKLDKQLAKSILDYMDERVSVLEDPTTVGKALTGKLGGFHRYRVGDIRVICYVSKETITITVLVLRVAHRRKVYSDEKTIAAKASADVDEFLAKREEAESH